MLTFTRRSLYPLQRAHYTKWTEFWLGPDPFWKIFERYFPPAGNRISIQMLKLNSRNKNGSGSPTTPSRPARSRKTALVFGRSQYTVSSPTSWLISRDLRQNWDHCPTCSITFTTQSNSMKKSPWRRSTQLDSSEIQRLLSNQNYHYRTHKSPQLASILSQMNTIQNLPNQISLRQTSTFWNYPPIHVYS